jgi:hypothetical protein
MTQTMDQGRNGGSDLGPVEERGISREISDGLMTQNRVEVWTNDSE